MHSYKIIVSGRGFDCKVFSLSPDQGDELSDIAEDFEEELSEEAMELICEVTSLGFLENDIDYFQSEKSIFGPNDQAGDFSVCVYDENSKLIFHAPNDWLEKQFEDEEAINNYQDEYWENDKLVMAQFCKADFFEYQLNLKEPFDAAQLKGGVTLIAETFSLLTDLYYNGNKLEYSEVFQDVIYSSYYGQLMIDG